jgi:hypothetical protein
MASYQNTSVTNSKLMLGNYKITFGSVATSMNIASAVTACSTNLGAGIINSFKHNITRYDTQAGNAPDPIEGVAAETFVITGQLIEYDHDAIVSAMGGIVTSGASAAGSTTADFKTITGGGATTLIPKAFLLTNTRMFTGSAATAITALTYVLVHKATFTQGLSFTAKADGDADPINVIDFEIEGVTDGTRTAGDQLFQLQKWRY